VGTQTVTLTQIAAVAGKTVTAQTLAEAGLVRSQFRPIKVVASGELKTAKTVSLPGASPQAQAAIVKAGGTFKAVPVTAKPKKAQPKGAKPAKS
jgi:large subunit ribosomal protein L15